MSSITIHGRHALLFDDDANAAFVNSREALVPFGGDDSCLIDRYDARHLLDRIPPRPVNKNKKYVEDTAGIDLAELDRERFLDLPLDEDDGLPENEDYERGDTEKSELKSSSSYQAVGFSYHNNEDSSDQKNLESNDSVFSPPFAVPTDLLNNLPRTEKLHQIMARTAIFVSEHGGQSEIVLRVKQGGNSTFGFLMPDNQLHPYFRFLVKHPQLLKHDNPPEKKNADNGGALSLLGSMYGAGEDDENANIDDSKDDSEKRGKEEPPFEKEPIVQQAVVTSSKEKNMVPKKGHLIAPSSTGRKKDGTTSKTGKKADVKPVILEPPSFLKRNVDKAVEFIQKNGRKFEAKLIEQDKTIGRFPFLLATNQFHAYYLKVLEEALESKSSDPTTKRKSEEIARDETVPDELVDDLPFNPHKKEKFTMLLGNTRREIVDQPSKPVQQSGVTADEAAMIVLAATRGQSPFPSTSTNDSGSKNISSNKEKTCEVKSNEANLSEVPMTKEQKIKAERLKRAKLFAAMIKSGAQPIPPANESKLEESNHAPINEPKHEEVNATEPKLEEFDEASAKERNYRKKNVEEEESDVDREHSTKRPHSEDKESKHRHRHSHRRHKRNHYSDDEDEHNKNHHRRRRHRHRSHKKYSDSESEDEDEYKESRHRRRSHRKDSDSEDEDKHEKSSRHRRRHSKHDLSEDEDRERSHKHRRKHRSPLEKEDLEEGELCDVANAASVESSDHTATEVPSDLRAKIRAMLLETL